MLAGKIFVSIVVAAVSLAVSVLTGQPPLAWPFAYSLAGVVSLLALVLMQIRQHNPA
ncbi:hypothetical protein [Pseudogemmobacter humi]|uniref:Uncharacterized protein n=1 Tax=Pseudogemmobacter humi TaxID=2483812 RepID=A0A3P5XJ36_9RHOB|nr:hypothetical protein [Pseudogemmobacter humi]VDC27692.1 hypothetical protein XINFAN_01924 [Pseudogemmobacter humi]